MSTTPASGPSSIFGGPILTPSIGTPVSQPTLAGTSAGGTPDQTPGSVASSNNTYIMPNSPMKNRSNMDGYRPKVTRTLGQRPACLVNASVTYCGNNQIYAFGGFDQYTDEVYNHVLRLDLVSHQWNLVDNYGDIPGVRMGKCRQPFFASSADADPGPRQGHTATLYGGDKLLVFGGENEHRTYLSDLIIFDLKSAHWTQPHVSGPLPRGRARHAAVLHDDKLFIIGGITGHDNYVLDDICYLDLKTFTWSKSWRFVGRFDHSVYIWGDRVWVFGGMGEEMEKTGDLWWLDLKGSPAFESAPQVGLYDRHTGMTRTVGSPRQPYSLSQPVAVGASGYAANSRTAQVNPPSFQIKTYAPIAPGTISSLKFVGGPSIPTQGAGIHFHVYSSGTLLDFVTPAPTITSKECSLSALDLTALRWQRLAEGREIFKTGYRWHYCTMNEDGTKAWLLGCPTDPSPNDLGPQGFEEYLR
jgi:galactose oxidase-like protein/Kelch motif protein